MRNFWSWLKSKKTLKSVPEFPPKKAFGNKAEEFLNGRKTALESFFNTLFEIKGVLDEIEVFKYLKGQCDEDNLKKLEDMIDIYKGRKEEVKSSPIQEKPKQQPEW